MRSLFLTLLCALSISNVQCMDDKNHKVLMPGRVVTILKGKHRGKKAVLVNRETTTPKTLQKSKPRKHQKRLEATQHEMAQKMSGIYTPEDKTWDMDAAAAVYSQIIWNNYATLARRKLMLSYLGRNPIKEIVKNISIKEREFERSLLFCYETPSSYEKETLKHQLKWTILQRSIAFQEKNLDLVFTELSQFHWECKPKTIKPNDKQLVHVNSNNPHYTLKNNSTQLSLLNLMQKQRSNSASKHRRKINFSQRKSPQKNVPNMYKQRHR